MAESAAHFTATLDTKPSIFEIIAQDSLNSTFHPALQKIANFLASINPKRFRWLIQYYEEVFLVLNFLLQYRYLRTTDASFSEYFYGLQRVSVNFKDKQLSEFHRNLSLVVLTILPYAKRKIEEKIQIYRLQNAERSLPTNLEGICKRLLLTIHSSIEIIWGLWSLVQYLRYMSGKSQYQSPLFQLLKIKLIYVTELQDDLKFWGALFRGQLSWGEISKGLPQNTLRSVLELSAFFLQFLQAWNAEHPNYSLNMLPTVEPPPLDNRAKNYEGKCPLCLQNWKIPTLLPVSGYVFCFPCIIRHLRNDMRCPVTKLPARPLDVIRLYDSDR